MKKKTIQIEDNEIYLEAEAATEELNLHDLDIDYIANDIRYNEAKSGEFTVIVNEEPIELYWEIINKKSIIVEDICKSINFENYILNEDEIDIFKIKFGRDPQPDECFWTTNEVLYSQIQEAIDDFDNDKLTELLINFEKVLELVDIDKIVKK